jgi:hypothetical protein
MTPNVATNNENCRLRGSGTDAKHWSREANHGLTYENEQKSKSRTRLEAK